MKNLIILFLFIQNIILAQYNISGVVIDSRTKNPLPLASINYNHKGTIADKGGKFKLKVEERNCKLKISYVGYKDKEIIIDASLKKINIIQLDQAIISSQTVLVLGSIGTEGVTPLAFSKIDNEQIKKNYTNQDVPEYLSTLPSSTFYSENGNGIGYNYLSIRGFDQRRISVSINGIPQNDPEDQNVYWLDMPDLLSSTGFIQVQRGAGSGVFGYPAIGGSINIITSPFANKKDFSISALYGSYNTYKANISLSSGLIDNKYAMYVNLSKTKSGGYRDKSYIDFDSYNLSVIRYDSNFTSQLNLYGGPIEDGLAYMGLPKEYIKDKDQRKLNYSDWGYNSDGSIWSVNRRPAEIENFSQPHFELLNEYKINENIIFNSALFYIYGKGFFDYDSYWADTSYFRLNQTGLTLNGNPANSIIRAQVENNQFGWIPRLSIKHENGLLIIGGEIRNHRSLHWGSINYATNLPEDLEKDYKYYQYKGGKDIYSMFVHEDYTPLNNLSILAEVQAAYFKYKLYDEKYLNNDFSVSNLFINPRAGINYIINDWQNIYITYSKVSKEPRLTNYYDAAESSGGSVPQFEQNADNSYDFSRPLVKPETMHDFEAGTSFNFKNFMMTLNGYYMMFNDEIVKNGKLDRFGQPITGNMDQTIHSGVEVEALYKVIENLNIFGNFTYGKNYINKGKYYLNDSSFINLSKNRISGFPDIILNAGITYSDNSWYVQVTGKYSGKFYSDNYDKNLSSYLQEYPDFVEYKDNVNEAFFNLDFFMSYTFNFSNSEENCKLFVQVNNVLNKLYSAYAIGKEFFPIAERNISAGFKVNF